MDRHRHPLDVISEETNNPQRTDDMVVFELSVGSYDQIRLVAYRPVTGELIELRGNDNAIYEWNGTFINLINPAHPAQTPQDNTNRGMHEGGESPVEGRSGFAGDEVPMDSMSIVDETCGKVGQQEETLRIGQPTKRSFDEAEGSAQGTTKRIKTD